MSDGSFVDTELTRMPVYQDKESKLEGTRDLLRGVKNPDDITELDMKNLLLRVGVNFHEKTRPIVIPKYSETVLKEKIDETKMGGVMQGVRWLDAYLNDQVITDQWGVDHDGRREWRTLFEQQGEHFYEVFEEVYEKHNQLRGNKITGVSTAVQTINRFFDKHGINKEIMEDCGALKAKIDRDMKDDAYHSLSEVRKIEYVRELEDDVASFLKKLFAGTDEYSEIMVT